MNHNFTPEDNQELISLAAEHSCNSREYGLLRSFIDAIIKEHPASPSIKVGDLVEVSHNMPLGGVTGIVDKIDGNNAYLQISNHISISMPLELLMVVQTREQMEACANGTAESCDIPDANNHDLGTIKIPVEVDIQDGYWEAYSAELAHDIAAKCAGTDVRSPKEIADYATEIARSVVENLKKK